MCTTPVLVMIDFTNTFILECNASEKGIKTILLQEGHSLVFTCKQLCD